MSDDINRAKFQGFALGVDVAKQLAEQGEPIDLNAAIRCARQIADGDVTTADPENSGRGLDPKTEKFCKDTAMKSIATQQQHASDVCDGIVSIVDNLLDED